MLEWLSQNYGTLLALGAVLLLSAAAIVTLLRDKKQGRSSCGSNCAHCAMAGKCHSQAAKPVRKESV